MKAKTYKFTNKEIALIKESVMVKWQELFEYDYFHNQETCGNVKEWMDLAERITTIE